LSGFGAAPLGLSLPAATESDGEIIKLLLELAHGRPEQGFGKLFKRLRAAGHRWNHKRVYRIYCSLKLNKRRKGKKRLPTRCPAPLVGA
jgi:putative transposase